uniref:Uncharacterized protein n=1 Tax=Avena sativa TaxID=4498 RepID=A0ACD5XVT8_AVESA
MIEMSLPTQGTESRSYSRRASMFSRREWIFIKSSMHSKKQLARLNNWPKCVKDVTELIGIEERRDELVNRLLGGDDWSKHPLKTVSIVGFGGLGKTTLAKAAYDKIKAKFDCDAFVSVSQSPNMKKVFKDILYGLDKYKYGSIFNATMDERQLIDVLIDFLTNKRYLIVIDDIWDEKSWQLIKCALSKNSLGSRLITTTRIIGVCEASCSSTEDMYIMKPLCNDVSRRLFHKRIFSSEKGCPNELVQVSEDILQKCGGVPLAIITMASLLACNGQIKGRDQWCTLLNSIGRGLTEDRSVEEMKKILLFSYYDLPSYLKPCLLYLSIFPEDHKIMRCNLVWKWISEGFVYSEKQETGLYELGDNYFNELVNRSLIQPIGIDIEEKVKACRVHDMVLDLIRSLASEENFVTILDGSEKRMITSQSMVRRLSIRNRKVDVANIRMAQVRSLTISTNDIVPQVLNVSNFQVLRVLDLEGCTLSDIRHLGSLLHLRYLRIMHYGVEKLPKEIGKLQLLQTLDISGTCIEDLKSVLQLRRLMRLCIGGNMKLPSGIRNLTSLEVLVRLTVAGNLNLYLVKELGHLTKLRVLEISLEYVNESMCKAFVESINNLHKLEMLDIGVDGSRVDLMHVAWVPHLQLRKLRFRSPRYSFLTLPSWINPSSLPVLPWLQILLYEVKPEDMQIIGMLPALRYLMLEADAMKSREGVVEMSMVTPDSFPCVTECYLRYIHMVPSMFPRGAAPRLERLYFAFQAQCISRLNFDLSMGHLPSLMAVNVELLTAEATNTEVMEAKAALRAVADEHPNRPCLHIYG